MKDRVVSFIYMMLRSKIFIGLKQLLKYSVELPQQSSSNEYSLDMYSRREKY